MLEKLKIDLGIRGTEYDERLSQYLRSAMAQIEQTGIHLNDVEEDQQLVVCYAAWLWRRRDSQQGMPRMVQYMLHNRLFAEKMREDS